MRYTEWKWTNVPTVPMQNSESTSLSLSYHVTFTATTANYLRDRRLPPRLNWILQSSGLLRGVRWFETDVSWLPVLLGQLNLWRWDRQVVPKRQLQTTLRHAIIQKTVSLTTLFTVASTFVRFDVCEFETSWSHSLIKLFPHFVTGSSLSSVTLWLSSREFDCFRALWNDNILCFKKSFILLKQTSMLLHVPRFFIFLLLIFRKYAGWGFSRVGWWEDIWA